mmetsp:Transcript_94420/g.262223  ORF Transcript_94420/g.262223 Transcript_94420/m.262223 type:complete len:568 (-) Transcript_94420:46-1749(-)
MRCDGRPGQQWPRVQRACMRFAHTHTHIRASKRASVQAWCDGRMCSRGGAGVSRRPPPNPCVTGAAAAADVTVSSHRTKCWRHRRGVACLGLALALAVAPLPLPPLLLLLPQLARAVALALAAAVAAGVGSALEVEAEAGAHALAHASVVDAANAKGPADAHHARKALVLVLRPHVPHALRHAAQGRLEALHPGRGAGGAGAAGERVAGAVVDVETRQVQRRGEGLYDAGQRDLQRRQRHPGAQRGHDAGRVVVQRRRRALRHGEARRDGHAVAARKGQHGRQRQRRRGRGAVHPRQRAVLHDTQRHVGGRHNRQLADVAAQARADVGRVARRVDEVGRHVRGRVHAKDDAELGAPRVGQRVAQEVLDALAHAVSDALDRARCRLRDGLVQHSDHGRQHGCRTNAGRDIDAEPGAKVEVLQPETNGVHDTKAAGRQPSRHERGCFLPRARTARVAARGGCNAGRTQGDGARTCQRIAGRRQRQYGPPRHPLASIRRRTHGTLHRVNMAAAERQHARARLLRARHSSSLSILSLRSSLPAPSAFQIQPHATQDTQITTATIERPHSDS